MLLTPPPIVPNLVLAITFEHPPDIEEAADPMQLDVDIVFLDPPPITLEVLEIINWKDKVSVDIVLRSPPDITLENPNADPLTKLAIVFRQPPDMTLEQEEFDELVELVIKLDVPDKTPEYSFLVTLLDLPKETEFKEESKVFS